MRKIVPTAELTISYGIPTWKYKGKYILYFAAYKNHMSVYPVFKGMLSELKGQLGDFEITATTQKSVGTIQFTLDNEVPEVIIKALITHRLKSIDQK